MRQQMRDSLAAESAEQGEARLQQMSDTQRERMAAETRQVRISERQQESLRSGEQTSQLFKQHECLSAKLFVNDHC